MDFFELRPLTDEQLSAIAKIESQHQAWRRKEGNLVELRRAIGDAFVALDLVVLQPICDGCRSQLVNRGSSPQPQIIRVWPELVDGRLRLYDRNDHNLYFFDNDNSQARGYAINCSLCQGDVASVNDHIIPVIPISFSENFGLEESGPKRLRGGAFRKWIVELYGDKCFDCERPLAPEDVTLDHIVARAKGGESIPANLQVLRSACNEQKNDDSVVTFDLALDFPLRPAPFDSYEGSVW